VSASSRMARIAHALAVRRARAAVPHVLEDIDLLAVSVDTDCRIAFCNAALARVTGWSRDELAGRDRYDTFAPPDRRAAFLARVAGGEAATTYDEALRTRSGEERIVRWSDSVVRDGAGRVVAVTSIGTDVTEDVRATRRLDALRDHDALTGLPNRTHFTARVDEVLALAREHGRSMAVLFVTLQDFRVVNDAFGQAGGDAVLRRFAARLRDAGRGAATVARNGNDEFLVLIGDAEASGSSRTHANAADVTQMAEALAARVRHALAAPFAVGGQDVYLNACIGVSQYPGDSENRDELMKAAHVDTYCGMRRPAGRRPRPRDTMAARDELDLVARLHRALARGEFVLHYQPIVHLQTRELHGVEALIRWRPPDGPMVPPGQFIPLAERTGLIAPITEWVVRDVCARTVTWRQRGIDLEIAFNFPGMLWDLGTITQLVLCIREQGLEPGALMLEVTETTIAEDMEQAHSAVEVVRSLGLRLAIDDFGTGYSSLWRLTQLPVAALKIDRSFVRDLPHDTTAATMTRTIVQLARNLGLDPLAEGIETEAQRRFLHGLGCELGQGFLFSPAVPPEQIEAMLADRGRRVA
jgi:diguanylate cyclase (GGDEF)-like protein/PAS domain S-box-containing protein